MSDKRFPVDRLEKFIISAVEAQGVPADHAKIFARRMIEADLRGMHGHGLMRLAPYSRRISEGGYNLQPEIRALRETPVSALVDGDNGLGQVVMTFAAELAIKKSKGNRTCLDRYTAGQPFGRGRSLRRPHPTPRHGGYVHGGGQRQPHATLGRYRHAAEHQPHGICDTNR